MLHQMSYLLILILFIAACSSPVTTSLVDTSTSSSVVLPTTTLSITPSATRTPKPPSKQIAFVSVRDGNSEIYVINVDGSDLRRISNTPLGDDSPTWAPDGSKIIFKTNIPSGAEIRLANPDGSQQTQLITDVARIGNITWSPDGKIIAYTPSTDQIRKPIIAFKELDRSQLVPDLIGHSEAWSPDSQRIVFVAPTKAIYSEIYVFNFADSSLIQLTHDSERQFVANYAPDWSPNGEYIAFATSDPTDIDYGDTKINVVRADGTDPKQLTSRSDKAAPISWSPDGSKIAYHYQGNIYVMHADGSHQTQLTSGGFDGGPVWSPDGSKIAFSSRGLDKDGSDDYDVFIINSDGTNLFQLTNSKADDYSPTWRPVP